jgi:methionyl-tRNA formyltransferase
MGKTMTGLSIFWPDDGLDEGPILLTKSCDISPTDTLSNIYFDKLFPMGVDAMLESLDLVKAGVILKYTQDLSMGSYESWFTKKIAQVDWNNSIDQVYNKIRAVDPAPGAWSTVNAESIDLYKATKSSKVGAPGSILSISDNGILISAQNGSVLVHKARLKGGKKKSSAELANELGLEVGDKFEFSPQEDY